MGDEELGKELGKLLERMDQPSVDGLNTYFAARAAARIGVKAVLSGVGGDEIFGGYETFTMVPRISRVAGAFRYLPWLGALTRMTTAGAAAWAGHPKHAGVLEYGWSTVGAYLLLRGVFMPWELPQVMDPEAAVEGWNEVSRADQERSARADLRNIHAEVCRLEVTHYLRNQLLRDTDWASMAHSVEVRTPLADAGLLQEMATAICSDKPPSKDDLRSAGSEGFRHLEPSRKVGFGAGYDETKKLLGHRGVARRGWALHVAREYARQTGSDVSLPGRDPGLRQHG